MQVAQQWQPWLSNAKELGIAVSGRKDEHRGGLEIPSELRKARCF